VEVLVALTIMSVAFAVLLQIIAGNLGRLSDARSETMAVSLTQSLLDQVAVTIPLRLGETTGDFGNGFHWRLHTEAYGSAEDQRAWPVAVMEVSAATLWDSDRKSVVLKTLRIGPKEQQ